MPPSSGTQAQRTPTRMTPRILVVEEEGDLRQLSSDVLMMAGYSVEVAEDGAAGWKAVCDGGYDLVVTDNKMPKVTGIELVGRMRAEAIAIPVIMATGSVPTAELERSPWLRISVVLQKPFTAAQLLGTVRGVLRLAGNSQKSASAEISPLACHLPPQRATARS